MSEIESNKATVATFFKALGSGDIDTMKALVTDDLEVITPGTAAVCGTRNYALVMEVANVFKQYTKSGIEFKTLSMTAEADRVSCELEGKSTLTDGTPYNNVYHFLLYFRGGKICLMKEYIDTKYGDAVLGPYIAIK